ncbi:hypothetical protein CPter291_0067 [Collimonas pratensis]|uniref:Uncharacterized protein n=1 Tax=Collimonas pratensis TaxID=279113 RepID=A0A127PYK9_9BURK|nr:hypothetical protein CPter91_0063 [Collimonas pratensis]AMP12363.1 hypothetical protein CPter291_0067 [Collimonas pratensis]
MQPHLDHCDAVAARAACLLLMDVESRMPDLIRDIVRNWRT